MKTIKYISFILILLSISCCVNQKQKDEEQIKNTVREYWTAVKNNDLQSYNGLIYESENFPGVTAGDLYFLHKHYKALNIQEKLKDEIKIKDTIGLSPDIKMKYVQYIFKKEDYSNMKKPLTVTLIFYKPIGFNKISDPVILENHIGWDK
ncbi:hypothetical protein QX233_16130 [Chryseobacterium gambrini]|uniref:Lipoprotein n=1 Tax=Chryseobacterium gambrini TaxID=373672 RepID=A0AAJ1VLP4_9FLAO|nr:MULTISPECIES: hypothetical protein [Chryseobacterium]MDN4014001.1 hypothetical protein [Chryseobacterium gambrini]MDN4031337.1 hypothetical protein [Chryseobacterium gambrini]QWA40335.1 hypothetical protein KKI44_09095 [Chryseobacterium sp. ZHDP1]